VEVVEKVVVEKVVVATVSTPHGSPESQLACTSAPQPAPLSSA